MQVYRNNNIIVRTIEEKDRNNYLKLFDSEDFGCIGINWDQKTSLSEVNEMLTLIINKEDISEEVLILEDENQFIGFITIGRPIKNQYHIGSLAVKQEKRKQGYGTLLLDIVKELAKKDNCYVKLECINGAYKYFEKQGFQHTEKTNFIYRNKNDQIRKSSIQSNSISSIFVDYSIIEEEKNKLYKQQLKKESESFQKFLKSPFYKDFFDIS